MLDERLEREALDVFEHEPHPVVAPHEIVERDDVRVAQGGEHPSLAFEGRGEGDEGECWRRAP